MKLRKKRKKDLNSKYNMQKSILILTMLICIIIAMITYWIFAYHTKYGDLDNNINLLSYKISDYLEIKGNIVYLKNIDESIINDFTELQQNTLFDNEVLNTDIKKELHKEMLSVMINYTLSNNEEKVLTINIDLRNDELFSNDELLDIIGVNYKKIAKDIFDEYIKLPSDYSGVVRDAITDTELTAKQFNENSEKYIIRIREKLPEIINLYIEDNKLNYNVDLVEIYEVCYYTNTNKLVNIDKELGQI